MQLSFKKSKSKGKNNYNNPHQVPNEVAEEIRSLPNTELVSRASLEYKNWMATLRLKKNDPNIMRLKGDIQEQKEEVQSDPEYQKLVEEFKRKKEEMITAEIAQLQEELKNLVQPYTEDIKAFRGRFKVAMDEISDRKDSGSFK